jgi:isochorismate synthase
MKAVEAKGSVIWRLPGSDKIQVLEDIAGNDGFMISFFERAREPKILRGRIRELDSSEIDSFFSGWDLEPASDKTSTLKKEYLGWVESTRREIAAGRLEKAVIARREWKSCKPGISDLYKNLLQHHKEAFVYAFFADGRAMIGASPETLLSKDGQMLYTEALGGTEIKDGFSEKEQLEHTHIYKYIATILSGLRYEYDSEPRTSRTAGNVRHLLTGFRVMTAGFEKDMELARQLHPTSAVCGVPYRESHELILATENFDRGYYTGFLGPVNGDRDFSFFVNLRCAELYRDGAVLFAGAGLNEMSDPESEWDETARKMYTVAQWL